MCKGFVKIPRRLFETRWWNQKRIYSESDAIIDLYQSTDKKNMVSGSRRAFANRWLWDDTRVHRFFARLQKDGYVRVSKTTKGTVIEILDFGTSAPPTAPPSAPPTAPPKTQSTKGFQETSAPPTAPPSAPPSAPPRAYKNDNNISCLSENDKNNPPLPPKGYEKISFDFVEGDFLQILFEWLEFKSSKGQKYKDEKSIKILYKKLRELSGGSTIKAREAVEWSIANNWSGIFEHHGRNRTDTRLLNNNDKDKYKDTVW